MCFLFWDIEIFQGCFLFVVCVHSGQLLSLDMKEILSLAVLWMDIKLSGINLSQKDKYCTVLLT